MNGGRPLRFLAILLSGWATARGIDIYNGDGPELPAWVAPVARAVASLVTSPAAATPLAGPHPATRRTVATVPSRDTADRRTIPAARLRAFASPPAATASDGDGASPQRPVVPLLSPAVLPPTIAHAGSRLAGSAWLIARNGSAPGVSGSQLGASQAGARITYALGGSRRVALAARISAPLSGRGVEAAVGLDWQPFRAPIHVIAEHRIALDGGRGGAMIGVVGGFGPVAVLRGMRLEGYGQAGVIARDGGEGFADGALRASHPLPAIGRLYIDIGAGIWGGAQRGAARLDIGPSVGVVVPVGRGSVRLTADWRERIAGDSRPDSGPALSIGTNF
ncbi:hypothetical protein NF700_10605 [Sphingomonadaceae bacterium OTU29MARTA1]|nr:hypothetical protein NF700_10605 [Sphingomonadaceae bacterium OTU29MARTA1]